MRTVSADDHWWIDREGKPLGPISQKELLALAEQGQLQPGTLIWRPGYATWHAASSVPGVLSPPSLPSPIAHNEPSAHYNSRNANSSNTADLSAGYGNQLPAAISATRQDPQVNRDLQKPSEHEESNSNELVGVGGWLLFLCCSFCILYPLLEIFANAKEWSNIRTLWHIAGMPAFAYFVVFSTIALVATSITIGAALWRRATWSVTAAKAFLLAKLALALLLPFSIFLFVDFTPDQAAGVKKEIQRSSQFDWAKALVSTLIWYSYLSFSRRVKATYSVH